MADIHIICVREDEQKAKALAEMFEAAGFSIGGAPSDDGVIHEAAAFVVVWSASALRSRPFLESASRALGTTRATVAGLDCAPANKEVRGASVYDLTGWNGDPNEPLLDPLFFDVDQKVNAKRAGTDSKLRDGTFRLEQLVRAQRPASSDALGSEAEHWRSIRDSRNPSDFMDYLARYGPTGAFTEVAELRLKQLTTPPTAKPIPPKTQPSKPPLRPTPTASGGTVTHQSVRPPVRDIPAQTPRPPPPAPNAPPTSQRSHIFISYRRSDSEAMAGWMCDRLIGAYGKDKVFFDVDTLGFGIDFESHIEQFLVQSRIMVAVIGPNWIGRTEGRARIQDPDDWVRREIEIALRKKIRILPVLVSNAQMPTKADLPESIRPLATLNAAPLASGRDFSAHMDRLIKAIGS